MKTIEIILLSLIALHSCMARSTVSQETAAMDQLERTMNDLFQIFAMMESAVNEDMRVPRERQLLREFFGEPLGARDFDQIVIIRGVPSIDIIKGISESGKATCPNIDSSVNTSSETNESDTSGKTSIESSSSGDSLSVESESKIEGEIAPGIKVRFAQNAHSNKKIAPRVSINSHNRKAVLKSSSTEESSDVKIIRTGSRPTTKKHSTSESSEYYDDSDDSDDSFESSSDDSSDVQVVVIGTKKTLSVTKNTSVTRTSTTKATTITEAESDTEESDSVESLEEKVVLIDTLLTTTKETTKSEVDDSFDNEISSESRELVELVEASELNKNEEIPLFRKEFKIISNDDSEKMGKLEVLEDLIEEEIVKELSTKSTKSPKDLIPKPMTGGFLERLIDIFSL